MASPSPTSGRSLQGGISGTGAVNWQWITVSALFLALLLSSALIQQPQAVQPYQLDSSEADGLLALNLWIEALGYISAELPPDEFTLSMPSGQPADLLFVYPNVEPYSEEHANELEAWIRQGGTLALIGPSQGEFELIDRFGVQPIQGNGLLLGREESSQPLLPRYPDDSSNSGQLIELDISNAPNAIAVLVDTSADLNFGSSARSATVAVQQMGAGRIWHLSPSHDLTNRALDIDQDGIILPALLRNVPEGGNILFDTYHLYGSSQVANGEVNSLQEWFYNTNPGRSLLLVGILLFGYLIMQGIRLGPPLPHVEAADRREAAEYVVAMAGLRRRLGEPTQIAQYQRSKLKQVIGKPLHIDNGLPDAEFIQQWRERAPLVSDETITEVKDILGALSGEITERMLVETAARIDKL